MRLYLDLCVYNRPFDSQKQERISLETSIFVYILEMVERNVYSEALVYENSKNPDIQRMIRVSSYFGLARESTKVSNSDLKRIKFIKRLGFSGIDALHVTLAKKSNADFFITCDDNIVNLYKRQRDSIKVNIVNLVEFIGLEVE
ncbi:MAG: hypothetical protein KBH94_06685 [Caldisericia bacterium]|nr:hypothetical protein [Caldisericia bacterium]